MRQYPNRRESGQALVEFLIMLPVLFILLMAVIQFGNIRYTQIIMDIAVRNGGYVEASGGDGRVSIENYLSEFPNIDMSRVDVRVQRHNYLVIMFVEVEIKYHYEPINLFRNVFPEDYYLTSQYII